MHNTGLNRHTYINICTTLGGRISLRSSLSATVGSHTHSADSETANTTASSLMYHDGGSYLTNRSVSMKLSPDRHHGVMYTGLYTGLNIWLLHLLT